MGKDGKRSRQLAQESLERGDLWMVDSFMRRRTETRRTALGGHDRQPTSGLLAGAARALRVPARSPSSSVAVWAMTQKRWQTSALAWLLDVSATAIAWCRRRFPAPGSIIARPTC